MTLDGSERRGYHHKDLRAAVLRAAADELQTTGAAGLSLRQVARMAGVSHAAPGHHFKDKRGLFTALATEGFSMLHRQTAASLDLANPLLGAGHRYIAFALEHPSHFAVMFDPSLLDTTNPDLERERGVAFSVLFEAIRRSTAVVDETELVQQTMAAWIVVHGAATLWLSGNLPYERDPRLVAEVLSELAPALLRIAEVSVGLPNSRP